LLTKAVSGFKYMVSVIENLIIGLVIGLISTTICYNTIKLWLMIKIFPDPRIYEQATVISALFLGIIFIYICSRSVDYAKRKYKGSIPYLDLINPKIILIGLIIFDILIFEMIYIEYLPDYIPP